MTKSSKPAFQATFGHRDQKWFFLFLTIIRVVGEPYCERHGREVSSVKYTTLSVSCFFRSPIALDKFSSSRLQTEWLEPLILLGFSVQKHCKVSNVAGFFLETLNKSVSFWGTIFPDFPEFEKMLLMRRYKKIQLIYRVISRNVDDFLFSFRIFCHQ